MHKNNELWQRAADDIFWFRAPTQLLDDSNPPFYRWYPDGVTNACYNAVDVHVRAGRGDQLAVIHDSPVTQTQRRISYQELLDEVSLFAGVLSAAGVSTGDRVIIYMPMVPEAIVAMLACARIGAIHCPISPNTGFSLNSIAYSKWIRSAF